MTVAGRRLRYPASREGARTGNWENAAVFALITGVRENLAPLALTGPAFAGKDPPAPPLGRRSTPT